MATIALTYSCCTALLILLLLCDAAAYLAVLDDPTDERLHEVLHEVWGFSAFRGLQMATIRRVLAGESLLAIMPTGKGSALPNVPNSVWKLGQKPTCLTFTPRLHH